MTQARPPWRSSSNAAQSLRRGTSTASLEELLARTADGDRDAYSEVFDRMGALVYGLVERVVVDPAQSEEVAQEVFAEVWRLAPRFDPKRGSATAWVNTIAHRRAVDRVRSEQAHRNRHEKVAHRDRERPFDEVVEAVETRMDHRRVRAALEKLTAVQRESIAEAFFGGQSYREVAERLDIPLGTVKWRIRTGLTTLGQELGAPDAEGG